MTELKPCPFCGGEADYDLDVGRTMTGHLTGTVACQDGCGCTLSDSHMAKTKKQLMDEIAFTWNHRPIEDALRARIKELEDFCVTLSGMKNTEGLDAEQMLEDLSEKAWMHLMGKIDD